MKVLHVIAVCVVASPAIAQEFQRTIASESNGSLTCVTWSKREFVYRVGEGGSSRTPGDSEFTAIDSAFATWQAVAVTCSDFTFTRGPRISNPRVGKGTESENTLVFREQGCREVVDLTDSCLADGSCANKYGCWDHSEGTIGLTTVTYSTRTGVAVDADIEFNASNFLFTTISSPPCDAGREDVTCVANDVQNTATHEIGHAVGFDHVQDVTSTMAPTAPVGETAKRVIDIGTASGFCQTYPRGLPPTPCDELAVLRNRIIARNVGTFGVSCANSSVLGAPLVMLAIASLLRRRRQR